MKIRTFVLLLFSIYLAGNSISIAQPVRLHSPDLSLPHQPGVLIIRTTAPLEISGRKASLSRLNVTEGILENVVSVEPALPWVAKKIASGRIPSHPLESIYKVSLDAGADLREVMDAFRESAEIEYAEPYYLYQSLILPNDPGTGSQYYLQNIRAFDAWNIEQGDTTITIAMLDTGMDYNHEDLRDNVQYNLNDPVNGSDDDGDGLVDNFFGWDMANNDNIPFPDTDEHGTAVSGVSSGTVNNALGLAGIGFNTRVLPIKIFLSGSNVFFNGYEAIALAADHGCQVINLSWGEAGAYSAFGEDIVRYAVLEKDVAIIAAAGNTAGQLDFYPASLPYVLSVGATDQSDKKANWGTHSPYIDLMAPGENIHTTFNNNAYRSTSGTSLSAPMVAAAVALVRARYPELNALQAMEKVRVNADNIAAVQQGGNWTEFIGKGRLNIFRALTDITSPALRVSKFSYNNGLGKMAYHKDTLTLDLEFTNYLYASGNANVAFSSSSPYVSFVSQNISLPGIKTLGVVNKSVQIVLAPNTPPNQKILLKLEYSSGAYADRQYIEFRTSPEWATLDNGRVRFSVAGNGNLGYAGDLMEKGVGFEWNNTKILDNIGLMIRFGENVADNIPIRQSQHAREQDFSAVVNLRPSADSKASVYYTSSFAPITSRSPLPVSISQRVYTWDSLGAVVLEYFITNTSDSVITAFQPAVYADFDIREETKNRLLLSDDMKFQYTRDDQLDLFGGIEVLSAGPSFLGAFDNRNLAGNASDLPPYFSDEVKLGMFLKEKKQAGVQGEGNDVSGIAGLEVTDLGPGEQVRFSVAISAAGTLASLEEVHEEVRSLYAEFRENPPIGLVSNFCPGSNAVVNPAASRTQIFSDPFGQELLFDGDAYTIINATGKQTLYAVDIVNGLKSDIYSILVTPADVATDFDMSADLLLLDETGNTRIDFTDKSVNATTWNWQFSNGYTSNKQNPVINFTTPGTYTITLQSSNALGCSGSIQKTVTVARRNTRPAANTFSGCPGSDFEINPADADSIHIYANEGLTELLYQGSVITLTEVHADTTLYITSLDGPYESLPAAWSIDIHEISAAFTVSPDTLDLSNPYFLELNATDENASFYFWELLDGANPPAPLGSDPRLLFDYSALSGFRIELTTFNNQGCSASQIIEITPAQSPPPVILPVIACDNAPVVIRPQEDDIYHFYQEPALTTLIGKGRELIIDAQERDTAVYVVNMSSLLESDPVRAEIEISALNAFFQSPGIVDLNSVSSIVLTDASEGSANSWEWQVNGEILGFSNDLEFVPDEEGEYLVVLTVTDDSQCQSVYSSTILAVYITAVEYDETTQLPFPNPADREISWPGIAKELRLIQADGRLVSECFNCSTLPVSGFPAGKYILQARSGQETKSFLVLIR